MKLTPDRLIGCVRTYLCQSFWYDDCCYLKPHPLVEGKKVRYPLFTEEKRMNDDTMPWPWNDTWIDIGGEG